MKLKENQLRLLRHLAQYGTLDYLSCLRVLDDRKTNDRAALSYAFRPLTKNSYAVRHKDGCVGILSKGRALFPHVGQLVTLSGSSGAKRRINEISRMAALLYENGIPSFGKIQDSDKPYFIPSTCWRKIRPGILSTTRFLGILMLYEHRLAIYNIGDGQMEWQLRAERSLFYMKHGEYETRATGMIFVCDDDKRLEAARNIIRHTMWRRRQLLGWPSVRERDRPVKYSRAPICLAPHYERVYLTTPNRLQEDIEAIDYEEDNIQDLRGGASKDSDVTQGDYEFVDADDILHKVFVNSTTDLLKFVYFFAAARAYQELLDDPALTFVPPVQYDLMLPKRDIEILRMYLDILEMEAVAFYEYLAGEDCEGD